MCYCGHINTGQERGGGGERGEEGKEERGGHGREMLFPNILCQLMF